MLTSANAEKKQNKEDIRSFGFLITAVMQFNFMVVDDTKNVIKNLIVSFIYSSLPDYWCNESHGIS